MAYPFRDSATTCVFHCRLSMSGLQHRFSGDFEQMLLQSAVVESCHIDKERVLCRGEDSARRIVRNDASAISRIDRRTDQQHQLRGRTRTRAALDFGRGALLSFPCLAGAAAGRIAADP